MEEHSDYINSCDDQNLIIENGYPVCDNSKLLLKGLGCAMLAIIGLFITFTVGATGGSASLEHMGTKVSYSKQ